MKLRPVTALGYVFRCAIIVAIYAILFQVMAHTRLMEKIMAVQVSFIDLLLIVLFLVFRLATYLLVPPLLIALGVREAAARLLR